MAEGKRGGGRVPSSEHDALLLWIVAIACFAVGMMFRSETGRSAHTARRCAAPRAATPCFTYYRGAPHWIMDGKKSYPGEREKRTCSPLIWWQRSPVEPRTGHPAIEYIGDGQVLLEMTIGSTLNNYINSDKTVPS